MHKPYAFMLINKDEYSIRTLAYYQDKGGVYNDIITVLQRLRKERKVSGPLHTYINDACFMFDATAHMPEVYVMEDVNNPTQPISEIASMVLTCLYAAFEPESTYLKALLLTHQHDKRLFPKFKQIVDKYLAMHDNDNFCEAAHDCRLPKEVESLRAENQNLQDELKAREAQILAMTFKLTEQSRTIESLNQKDVSKLDKTLTLRYVLDYIKSRRQFKLSDQILGMLKDLARLATDEEYEEIKQVEQMMLDASVPKVENHNDIQNSNVFPGLVNNPSFPIGVNPEELIKKVLAEYSKGQNDGQQQ